MGKFLGYKMGITNKTTFHSHGISFDTPNGKFTMVAGQGIGLQPAGDSVIISTQPQPNIIANGNGLAWQPPSFSNANAPKNSIYFSTNAGKLVYKSANGSNVFALY
jgi:hypothetical protein